MTARLVEQGSEESKRLIAEANRLFFHPRGYRLVSSCDFTAIDDAAEVHLDDYETEQHVKFAQDLQDRLSGKLNYLKRLFGETAVQPIGSHWSDFANK